MLASRQRGPRGVRAGGAVRLAGKRRILAETVLARHVRAHWRRPRGGPRRASGGHLVVGVAPAAVVAEAGPEALSFSAGNEVPARRTRAGAARLNQPEEVHEASSRAPAPILANNLLARLDGKTLTF